jgi:hypothetical protein
MVALSGLAKAFRSILLRGKAAEEVVATRHAGVSPPGGGGRPGGKRRGRGDLRCYEGVDPGSKEPA